MAKIWCEKCYGTGKQQWQQSSQNIPYDEPCESCQGKGYTESPETQRLLAIGMATVEAMKEIEEERQRVFKNCKDSTDSEGKKQHFWRLTGLMFALDRLEWHKKRDAK